jgi:hypothetical protein
MPVVGKHWGTGRRKRAYRSMQRTGSPMHVGVTRRPTRPSQSRRCATRGDRPSLWTPETVFSHGLGRVQPSRLALRPHHYVRGRCDALAIVSFQVTPADHVAVFDEGTAGIRIAKCTPCKASPPRKFQKLNSLEYEKAARRRLSLCHQTSIWRSGRGSNPRPPA